MEKELEKILKVISENPKNKVIGKEIFSVFKGVDESNNGSALKMPVVTVDSNEKYAKIHGNFGKTAILDKGLKPLLDYIADNGYSLI